MKGKEESKYPPAEPGELPCWFSRTRTVVRTTQDLAPNSVLRACRNTDRTGSCETGLDARLRDPPALTTTAQGMSFQSAASGPRLNVRRSAFARRHCCSARCASQNRSTTACLCASSCSEILGGSSMVPISRRRVCLPAPRPRQRGRPQEDSIAVGGTLPACGRGCQLRHSGRAWALVP